MWKIRKNVKLCCVIQFLFGAIFPSTLKFANFFTFDFAKFTLLHRVGAARELKLRGVLSNQIEEFLEYGRQLDQAISLCNDHRMGLAPHCRKIPPNCLSSDAMSFSSTSDNLMRF